MFKRRTIFLAALSVASLVRAQSIDLGSRRELFVDHYLIDTLKSATLELHRPVDRGPVFKFDNPWEGRFCAYVTVLHPEPDKYQIYYRGSDGGTDSSDNQVTCYAESTDGINWVKPQLDLFPIKDHSTNNIVLAHAAPVTHNFSPFIDAKPGTPASQKYKAMGGYNESGMMAYASPDGVHWSKLSDKPVLTREQLNQGFVFDSQNVPFYSELEGKYFLYYRLYKNHKRRVARVESTDFLTWSNPQLMEYTDGNSHPFTEDQIEELYINQTAPYFRAPHIYVSTAARFMINRQVITAQQAEAIKVDPKYFHDTCDAILQTSRGGNTYDRTFMTAFVAPGIGIENWTSRTNYPALNVVQTSPTEMSVYVNQNYAQPTSHLRRYTLRLDGFASLHAPYTGGEMVTKPLKFSGSNLLLNYSTSSPGFVKVELQDESGAPLPGYTVADCQEIIGNELDRSVAWKGGDLSSLAGKSVRLHFVMKDADIFSFHFGAPEPAATPQATAATSSTRNPQ